MGDEEDHLRRAPPDVEDQLLRLLARQRVERAERLVHQQRLGVGGERAGDADALLHAARKLVDHAVAKFGEADQRQLLTRDRVALAFA